jgi:hypothetical protein
VAVDVVSARVAQRSLFPLCSAGCRELWWAEPATQDLIDHKPIGYPLSRTLPEEIVHDEDTALAVVRRHYDPVQIWAPHEAVAIPQAVGINPYWRTPPSKDHQLAIRPIRCDATGLLEIPPAGWDDMPVKRWTGRLLAWLWWFWLWLSRPRRMLAVRRKRLRLAGGASTPAGHDSQNPTPDPGQDPE